jgi:hypothetical protein
MARRKRAIEEIALSRMKLLSSWLNFWMEDVDQDPDLWYTSSVDFGVTQIVDLQECLERLKVKLERREN